MVGTIEDEATLLAHDIDSLIDRALLEDLGPEGLAGDLTTRALGISNVPIRGRVTAKAPGVLSGLALFRRVFERLDPAAASDLGWLSARSDGDSVAAGDLVCEFRGRADVLLAAERTALNFLQQLSGVATLTAEFVARTRGTNAQILDTRKTTPCLRAAEKQAVLHGGGQNHRFGLHDAILIKENHFAAAGLAIGAGVERARRASPECFLVAEVIDEQGALDAARQGADVVMLDNFTLERGRATIEALTRARTEFPRAVSTEVSGGISLDTVREWAETGVDRISVGALTHSARALDLSLCLDVSSMEGLA